MLSPAAKPISTLFGSQPICFSTSSFSASTTRQVLPKVALSVLCGRKPATLRRYRRQKRPMDGVRHEAVAQRALRIVEAELLDDGAVEDDQRVAARRVAAVLDAVFRIAHGFDQRDEHRHVFGPAAGHHAVDRDAPDGGGAFVGQQDAEHFVRAAVGKAQERFDVLARRRHDGQPVGELVLVEIAVDFLEAAFDDDVARAGLGRVALGLRHDGEIVDDGLRRDFEDVAPQLLRALVADVAGHQRDRYVRACRVRSKSPRPGAGKPSHVSDEVG